MFTYNYDVTGLDTAFSGLDYTGFLEIFLTFFVTFAFAILAISILIIIAKWMIFNKAEKPGWASIIPIYDNWVLFETVGMKGWYSLLILIPFVGGLVVFIFNILAMIKLATCFNKDSGFAVGLILLPYIFLPILAFGKSTFTAPVVTTITQA